VAKPSTISILSDVDYALTGLKAVDGQLRDIMRASDSNRLTEDEAGEIGSRISGVIDILNQLNRNIRGTE